MEYTKERIEKLRESHLGAKNFMWRGDEAGYTAIHHWVRRHKPEPKLCEYCHTKKPHDLANISLEYKRNINDWEYLCRRCHMLKDGRIKELHSFKVGNVPWNRGLTKNDHPSIRACADKKMGNLNPRWNDSKNHCNFCGGWLSVKEKKPCTACSGRYEKND